MPPNFQFDSHPHKTLAIQESVVASRLYEGDTDYHEGYDVHAYNENDIVDMTSASFREVVSAVNHRTIDQIAILGYSQGGGATYLLSTLLALNAVTNPIPIDYTGYIDGIQHDDANVGLPETRRPVGSNYHVQYWQHIDRLIKGAAGGGDVEVNVNDTFWGAALNHTTIDHHPTTVSRYVNGYLGPVTPFEPMHFGLIDLVEP